MHEIQLVFPLAADFRDFKRIIQRMEHDVQEVKEKLVERIHGKVDGIIFLIC